MLPKRFRNTKNITVAPLVNVRSLNSFRFTMGCLGIILVDHQERERNSRDDGEGHDQVGANQSSLSPLSSMNWSEPSPTARNMSPQ